MHDAPSIADVFYPQGLYPPSSPFGALPYHPLALVVSPVPCSHDVAGVIVVGYDRASDRQLLPFPDMRPHTEVDHVRVTVIGPGPEGLGWPFVCAGFNPEHTDHYLRTGEKVKPRPREGYEIRVDMPPLGWLRIPYVGRVTCESHCVNDVCAIYALREEARVKAASDVIATWNSEGNLYQAHGNDGRKCSHLAMDVLTAAEIAHPDWMDRRGIPFKDVQRIEALCAGKLTQRDGWLLQPSGVLTQMHRKAMIRVVLNICFGD